jgi:hypothetical protein
MGCIESHPHIDVDGAEGKNTQQLIEKGSKFQYLLSDTQENEEDPHFTFSKTWKNQTAAGMSNMNKTANK